MAKMTKEQKDKIAKRQQDFRDAKEMMRRHASQLSEHFSCVQIVGTKLEPDGGTMFVTEGSGDIMARIKCAEEWSDLTNEVYLGNK